MHNDFVQLYVSLGITQEYPCSLHSPRIAAYFVEPQGQSEEAVALRMYLSEVITVMTQSTLNHLPKTGGKQAWIPFTALTDKVRPKALIGWRWESRSSIWPILKKILLRAVLCWLTQVYGAYLPSQYMWMWEPPCCLFLQPSSSLLPFQGGLPIPDLAVHRLKTKKPLAQSLALLD